MEGVRLSSSKIMAAQLLLLETVGRRGVVQSFPYPAGGVTWRLFNAHLRSETLHSVVVAPGGNS